MQGLHFIIYFLSQFSPLKTGFILMKVYLLEGLKRLSNKINHPVEKGRNLPNFRRKKIAVLYKNENTKAI